MLGIDVVLLKINRMKIINIVFAKCFFVFLFVTIVANYKTYAQYPETLVRKGNSDYKNEKYKDAETKYRKAKQKDSTNIKALFNLGDALYQQKQFNQAADVFKLLSNQNIDDELKAKVFHNLGNSQLSEAMFSDTLDMNSRQNIIKNSINSYKNSLRLNPDDDETRYNYVYANKLLKKMENQQNQQNQQNQDKEQDKDKQDEQNQQQNKNDDDKKKKEQQQKPEISKEDAERMLEAIKNNEKNTREKLEKSNQKSIKTNIENDW